MEARALERLNAELAEEQERLQYLQGLFQGEAMPDMLDDAMHMESVRFAGGPQRKKTQSAAQTFARRLVGREILRGLRRAHSAFPHTRRTGMRVLPRLSGPARRGDGARHGGLIVSSDVIGL